ncbi:uncharacterized protein At3g43530-like [Eutrema salsugineum]|uniref:uncharacterized protein At3g43530-like n=1 Tax=Eutrema salsugineum TaxID=72664 RepID=UPI000CED597E|nr:uncharacterized protein At3g43530-like [Eutrema salsugineum]
MFNINIKLSGRCYIEKVVKTLEKVLDDRELKWFKTHPQFKHFFHMYLEENHKSQGMWMLMLCMVPSSKMKECWFVVNGVPIRYSLRELGLISGLNCRSYPKNYESLGGDSSKFVAKYFGEGKKKVTLKDVDEKMESMKSSKVRGRMNIAVLYFLANIIVGKTKTGNTAAGVEHFFLRAASDLDLCETFPWGRFAFDQNMKDIRNIVKNLNVIVPEGANKVFPSFIIPMELLAYEAIPALDRHFREAVVEVEDSCPRMCKSRFKKGDLKGFALSEINSQLGATKDIHSVLAPSHDEKQLLALIMDDEDIDQDVADYIVDGWKSILLEEKSEIFFQEMFKKDVNSRKNKGKKASDPKNQLMELYVGEEKNRNQEDEENRLNFLDADYHGGGEEANDGAGCSGKKQTEGDNVEENVEKDKEENEEVGGEGPTHVTRRTSGRTSKKSQYKQTPFTEDKKGKKRSTKDEKKKGAPKGKKQKT